MEVTEIIQIWHMAIFLTIRMGAKIDNFEKISVMKSETINPSGTFFKGFLMKN